MPESSALWKRSLAKCEPKMTDKNTVPVTANTVAKLRRRRPWGLYFCLFLLLVVGIGGWLLQQLVQQRLDQINQDVAKLDARAAQLDTRQSALLEVSQHNASQVATFAGRLDTYDQVAGKLSEQVQGGRVRFQLAAVENLLLAANERVQLQRDVPGAITALKLADERLAALSEPRLFKLREAIAQEQSALQSAPKVDSTSVALTLSSLISRVPKMPLHARVPERVNLHPEHVELPADAPWTQRFSALAREALTSVFSVRRNDGPTPRLLTADQETLVYQVLMLKLEGARVALLRGDAASFTSLCEGAGGWLREYFRNDDPNVLEAQAELERLSVIKLDADLPDITRSLTLLRGYLDSAAQ